MVLAEGLKSQDAGMKMQTDKKPKKAKELFEDAIGKYEEALKLDPALARAHREMGVVLATIKKDEQAVEHYREYMRLAPDAEDAAKVKQIIADWETAAAKKGTKKKK